MQKLHLQNYEDRGDADSKLVLRLLTLATVYRLDMRINYQDMIASLALRSKRQTATLAWQTQYYENEVVCGFFIGVATPAAAIQWELMEKQTNHRRTLATFNAPVHCECFDLYDVCVCVCEVVCCLYVSARASCICTAEHNGMSPSCTVVQAHRCEYAHWCT